MGISKNQFKKIAPTLFKAVEENLMNNRISDCKEWWICIDQCMQQFRVYNNNIQKEIRINKRDIIQCGGVEPHKMSADQLTVLKERLIVKYWERLNTLRICN